MSEREKGILPESQEPVSDSPMTEPQSVQFTVNPKTSKAHRRRRFNFILGLGSRKPVSERVFFFFFFRVSYQRELSFPQMYCLVHTSAMEAPLRGSHVGVTFFFFFYSLSIISSLFFRFISNSQCMYQGTISWKTG